MTLRGVSRGVWVRRKGLRDRLLINRYYVRAEKEWDAEAGEYLRTDKYQLIGVTVNDSTVALDEGTEDAMNARWDEMATYQDRAAFYKSGVMWCYDMNVAVGEPQRKVSGGGVS